ncbi:RNase P/RNase MRP complex subunit [Actinomortierella ambigua]|uniref:Ribonuclease P protein subunit p29 n=1 Tax=Actinomortierella ambigua TaxID=1343610 RepID=A0A9P6QD68_9FUNG|nr:RNase P/RNase MRP complex subunit [Actinomortierella ambigua]KAG0265784.1 RNase P/RNase MRP complex subunit [Actinomortierella ambigua]
MSNQDRPDLSLYSKLSEQDQDNAGIGPSVPRVDSETGSFVRKYVGEAVVQGYDKEGTFNTKVKNKVFLLDNPAKDTNAAKEKVKEKKKRDRKAKALNAREKRNLKVYDIPQDARQYIKYLPLHELWKSYMNEIFGGSTPIAFVQKLLKADLHGACITVTRSKCPSYVGQTGIMVQETEQTFQIITEKNALRTIPKQNSIFCIRFGENLFTIYGNHYRYRVAQRSAKKFKAKPTIDL